MAITRAESIKVLGCVPCLLDNLADSHAEIHHIVEQGYRKGDHISYGNCSWHHRGIPWDGLQAPDMEKILGPSLRLAGKAYHERYGDEMDLLQTQDYLLHLFARDPWEDHNMPAKIAKKVRSFWKDLKKRNE